MKWQDNEQEYVAEMKIKRIILEKGFQP